MLDLAASSIFHVQFPFDVARLKSFGSLAEEHHSCSFCVDTIEKASQRTHFLCSLLPTGYRNIRHTRMVLTNEHDTLELKIQVKAFP